MEFQFFPFTLNSFNIFLLLSFLVLLWKKVSKTSKETGKLPPGPMKLPLFGNIHNLIGGLPHYVLRDLAKKYGPLMHLQLGEVPAIVVTSAEMAKEVLVTNDPAFAGRPERLAPKIIWYNQEDMAFSPYGEHWKQMRKICMMELLSGKNVRSFSFIRKDEMLKLTESIRSLLGVPINVTDKFFAYTSSMTCRASFGRICKDKEIMIDYIKKIVILAAGFDAADVFPSVKILPIVSGLKGKLLKMHEKMDIILDDVINQHKLNHKNGKMGNAESGDEDLIDVLLRLHGSGNLQIPITIRNIKGIILVSTKY
ncbi:hypothetical protein ACH5RR_041148 [Cinchona calisaya]|uniref:Cytochrome P450 n=1 Tax=Cinchona calisaya TaxID=153742 RepID=A0ABD2XVB4_9GENT